MLQWFGSIWIDEKGDIYDKDHGLWDCPYVLLSTLSPLSLPPFSLFR